VREVTKLQAAYEAASRQRPKGGRTRHAAAGCAQKASHLPRAISGGIAGTLRKGRATRQGLTLAQKHRHGAAQSDLVPPNVIPLADNAGAPWRPAYKETNDPGALVETARRFGERYSDTVWAKKSSVWSR
jgi:hypothetical protein